MPQHKCQKVLCATCTALALGGITDGVTNLEMTAAYATIANQGTYTRPVFYSQVIDSSTVVYKDAIQSKVDAISEYMKLPQSLSDNITESAAMKILDSAGTSAEVTIKEMAAQIFAAQLSAIIINAICYCIVFVILYIILKVFMGVTGVISRLPVIHQADKLCGTIAGIVEGLIIVWVVFAIVTAFGNNVWASDILAQIHSSSFLEFIYDNNIIMKMIIS